MDRIRSSLRESSDPRAARTRASLFAAALTLCDQGNPVTVSALIREAGVSRSVFYTHFADLGQLAVRMLEPHVAEISARASEDRATDPHGAMLRAQRQLVATFQERQSLYRAAFQLPGHAVAAQVEEAIHERMEVHIDEIGGAPEGLRSDISARYVASAAARLIEHWVLGQLEVDADLLALHLHDLMPPWMHERAATSPTQSAVSTPRKEIP